MELLAACMLSTSKIDTKLKGDLIVLQKKGTYKMSVSVDIHA